MTRLSLLVALLFSAFAAQPALAADEFFDSNGVKIRYVIEGDKGDAVVLIHGWMADSSMWGADAARNTKLQPHEGLRLIALDCRGHGKSGAPAEQDKYGVEMAEDVIRLLDHLKIEKAHLLGYSSGAFIAGKVAAAHPERVISVIYACQAPVVPNTHVSFAECEAFAEAVKQGKGVGGLGQYFIDITPEDRPKPTMAQAEAWAKFVLNGKDVNGIALAGLSFKDLEVTADDLNKCPAPMLFIRGGNESAHVKNRVDAVHALLPQSELKIIEGGDHMTTLAKPEFVTTIIEFWEKNSPTAKGEKPDARQDKEGEASKPVTPP